jgi:hypothetical protein
MVICMHREGVGVHTHLIDLLAEYLSIAKLENESYRASNSSQESIKTIWNYSIGGFAPAKSHIFPSPTIMGILVGPTRTANSTSCLAAHYARPPPGTCLTTLARAAAPVLNADARTM